MKAPNIFPHREYCSDRYGWAECPSLAKAVWLRIRPSLKDMCWCAVDMQILSETSIRLFVYTSNYNGGIGERIHEQVITEFTAEEQEMLDASILTIKTNAAFDELQKREAAKQRAAIMKIRKELFGV